MRQPGALSLDLDNLWSYLKIHGDPQWSEYPSYLSSVVPTILQELRRNSFRITFFIVGRDAERQENAQALRSIAQANHDVGNHSYSHESWMHTYDIEQTREEIVKAEDAIAAATGIRPRGFRGPGFAISDTILDVLTERGYVYDASTLPTFIGPLARAYYFRTSKLSKEERANRENLFGDWSDGKRPNRPYWWSRDAHGNANVAGTQDGRETTEGKHLLEIPVTVMPLARIPFHVSYLLYIAGFSQTAAIAYFTAALELCKVTRTMPSLLLHPLDFVGAGEAPGLEFFPGMSMSGEKKRLFVRRVLATYGKYVDVMTMDEAARHLTFLTGDALESQTNTAAVPRLRVPPEPFARNDS